MYRPIIGPVGRTIREETPSRCGEAYIQMGNKGDKDRYVCGVTSKQDPNFEEHIEECLERIKSGYLVTVKQAKDWLEKQWK